MLDTAVCRASDCFLKPIDSLILGSSVLRALLFVRTEYSMVEMG